MESSKRRYKMEVKEDKPMTPKKCVKCGLYYETKDLVKSADLPSYMYESKDEAKGQARWLVCKECLKRFEWMVIVSNWSSLTPEQQEERRQTIKAFAEHYFK